MTPGTSQKPHICFVALWIWPVLSGDRNVHYIGGAEVQQTTLARLFLKAGYKVSILTANYGQPEIVDLDGIMVYRLYKPYEGLPVIRFFYPRLTKLWSCLKKTNADIYYQRGSGSMTGIIATFCRLFNKKFLFAAASDADFDLKLPLIKYGRDRWLYRSGLKQASAVIVQNVQQQQACKTHFHRDSTLIPSCYAVPEGDKANIQGYILWVSTIRSYKRPELFIELARRLPEFRFCMIGGGDGSELDQRIKTLVSQTPNLNYLGYVDYQDMNQHFNQAKLFINTSEFEGFPNTFLQAWSRGIPTVSFFNTGSIEQGQPVIQVANDFEHMVESVQQLMQNPTFWEQSSQRSKQHYQAQHQPGAVLNFYERVFEQLQ